MLIYDTYDCMAFWLIDPIIVFIYGRVALCADSETKGMRIEFNHCSGNHMRTPDDCLLP